MAEARVMIVEDETSVAEDLLRPLEAAGYTVVGRAVTPPEAVSMARELKPDVILMDVCLGEARDGIDAAVEIQKVIDRPIVYVSDQSEASLVADAVEAGAFGYVLKPFQTRQLLSSIEIALHRHRETRQARPAPAPSERRSMDATELAIFSTMLHRLQAMLEDDHAWADTVESPRGNGRAVASVTPREKEIIRGLVCYRRLGKVADVLGISVHTARNHLKSIFRKLDLHSQDELFQFLSSGAQRNERVGQSH